MNQIEIINIMNEAMIKFLKEKNMDYSANVEIRENLKDEAYFFKIDKIKAYKILEIIGVKKSQLEEVYKKLISPNRFYELVQKGKIKYDDTNIIVKYNDYRI